MAVENLTTLASALGQRLDSELKRQWNRRATTLSLIPQKAGYGINAAWDANVGGASAGTVAEGADVSSGEYLQDTMAPAILNWSTYRTAFGMSHIEMAAAASSGASAPSALVDIFGERVLDSIASLASKMNVDALTANGTDGSGNNNFVGLLNGALPVAGQTYAGLAVNTYSQWASNVLANGGVARPLTVDLLNQADKLQFQRAGQPGDFILCSPGVYQKYAGMFESIRRVNGDTSKAVYGTGAAALEFMGMPVVRDKDMTEGTMVFCNSAHVELKYLPPSRTASMDSVQSAQKGLISSNGDFSESLGLPISMYSVAKSGSSSKFWLEVIVALCVKRPNAFVLIQDISVT